MIDDGTADRGVTMAVTHVLALGISAALLAVLLAGSGAVLETETERAAERSLETVGQELAGEIEATDRLAAGGGAEAVARADAPRTVARTGYAVEARSNCPGAASDTGCLRLSAHTVDATATVPVSATATLESNTVSGGPIEIVVEDERVTLEVEDQ
ncbi:hypothetical protein QA600_19940 [Natronococcus sp. A-GB1]|uniref:DUF7266 family protein n=1 Tax=Natronococcus sp. A-GB1 TaxID=3037648 RepID=UPI00241F6AFF|nr:hypothetical protein [Natronococcus sp. A-GB1]MDG5761603.1 hypothetical protein [Natronococcus sp. A-GB1]